MKNLLLLFLLVSSFAHAGPVALRFESLPLREACKVIYTTISGESFAFDPRVDSNLLPVTLDVKTDSEPQAIQVFENYLNNIGLSVVRDKTGVVFLSPKIPDSQLEPEFWFYRPKHLPVSDIRDALAPLLSVGYSSIKQPGQADAVSSSAPASGSGSDQSGLIISARPDRLKIIQEIISKIDQPVPQLVIESGFLEVSNTRTKSSAVSVVADFFSGNFALSVEPLLSGFSLEVGAGGLSAALRLLDSDSRFKVVSSPSVVVRSGAKGSLAVGTETPVLGSTIFDQAGNERQSVEYRTSGVQLEVSPVFRGGKVALSITQSISDFVKTVTGVEGSPTLLKREMFTEFDASPGRVYVLGGLSEADISSTSQGLFGWSVSDSNTDNDSDLVLLLRVSEVSSQPEIKPYGLF